MIKQLSIIGYSGHALVILEQISAWNISIRGYYDINLKESNPFNLEYLGKENNSVQDQNLFICKSIG